MEGGGEERRGGNYRERDTTRLNRKERRATAAATILAPIYREETRPNAEGRGGENKKEGPNASEKLQGQRAHKKSKKPEKKFATGKRRRAQEKPDSCDMKKKGQNSKETRAGEKGTSLTYLPSEDPCENQEEKALRSKGRVTASEVEEPAVGGEKVGENREESPSGSVTCASGFHRKKEGTSSTKNHVGRRREKGGG